MFFFRLDQFTAQSSKIYTLYNGKTKEYLRNYLICETVMFQTAFQDVVVHFFQNNVSKTKHLSERENKYADS